MLLSQILPIAERIQSILSEYCDRIEIAGSIRRARPDCNDIHLVLLCRTGSREHNIWLATVAKKLGLHWDPPRGIHSATGQIVASETEEDIYRYLGVDYLPAAFREPRFLPHLPVASDVSPITTDPH